MILRNRMRCILRNRVLLLAGICLFAVAGGLLFGDHGVGHAVQAEAAATPTELATPGDPSASAPAAGESAPESSTAVASPGSAPVEASVSESEAVDCYVCHGDPSLSATNPDGSARSMYIDKDAFSKLVHGGLDCVMCHTDAVEIPHNPDLAVVNCGECHTEEMEEYSGSLHAVALNKGDHDAASCKDCHGIHDMRTSTDPLSRTHPARLVETCGVCHSDPVKMKKHMVSVMHPSDSYMKSAHARALASGKHAATCKDCHGTHDLKTSQDTSSPISRMNIPKTCGKCHEKAMKAFDIGIHGKALQAGIKDAPTCTDCHGEHNNEGPEGEDSAVSQQLVSRSTCPSCHDDEKKMERYGITVWRQASYMDSYHGMASAAGSKVVASCASCHGAHDILPSSDPNSAVNKANLPQTCGKCHDNAGPNFAVGAVHIMPTDPGQKALGIVRLVYLWLIALLLGGMVIHNSLLMLRHVMVKFRKELNEVGTYKRFSLGQTVGHFILTVSFVALAISGFALRYPDVWWLKMWFFSDASLETRGLVHRIAGAVLIVLVIVHALHTVLRPYGRKELWALFPKFKDVKDVIANMKYTVGLASEGPKYDRYSYSEKMEYWGMMWGTVLMGVTGLAMWFAGDFLRHIPKIFLDIIALIHFYEAWLAVGTIVIWHFYYMILDPVTYPMNWSWITGRITEEDFKEHHPLEFERVVEGEGADGKDAPVSIREKSKP